MSRTVTRSSPNSCNYPYRYSGHKQHLARMAARKVEPMPFLLASYGGNEFTVVDMIAFEPAEFAGGPNDEPEFCGCYCRRCVLHDDHGGCTEPWNHKRGTYHAGYNDTIEGFWA